MKILMTTPFVPYPPIEGGRTIPYRYLEGLSREGHEVTLLVALRRPEDRSNLSRLREHGDVVAVEVTGKSGPGLAMEALRTNGSLRIRRHSFAAVASAMSELLRKEKYDLICLESLFTAYLLGTARSAAPSTPIVLMQQNVESRLFRRLTRARSGAWRLLGLWECGRIERAEREAVRRATAVVALSDEDAAALKEMDPAARTLVQPPGIQVPSEGPAGPPARRDTVLFLGSYDWPPNRDGVHWLLDEVWPRVRGRHPAARLILAGNDPGGGMRRLNDPGRGIDARGFVDDPGEVFREAAFSVAPIRFGSGVRLKILESLAVGRTLVTTGPGLEGLPFRDSRELLVADDPGDFAAAMLRLIDDPALADRLAAQGYREVEQAFSWEAVTRRLARLLEEVGS